MATIAPQSASAHLPLITLIALLGMAPLSGLAVSGIAPVMPLITAEFADDPNAGLLVRMMMSGLSAATILGALASGIMASRIGQLRLLLVLLALYVVSGAGIFLLDNLYLMVAARCLQGIANGGAGVLAIALITTRVPGGRSDHWLGYYTVSGTFGVLFLMMAVGWIAALGWRYVFLIFLLAVPVALMIGLTMRGREVTAAARGADTSGGARPGGIPWALTLFAALSGAIVTAFAMYLPYHLAAIGRGSPDTIALLMVAGAGVAGVPALAYGWIKARFSVIQIFMFCFFTIAVSIVIVVLARDLPLIVMGMALQGFGMGAMMPNLFSGCAAATPTEDRARMLGFVRAGIYAGPLLAQPALEAVMALSGAAAALFAIAAASVAAGLVALLGRAMFDPVGESVPA